MSVDERELGLDLMQAQRARGYSSQFSVKLIWRDVLNPFRAYFYFRDEWWPARVTLDSYPMYSNPTVAFEQRIPPCPVHTYGWHPNVFDRGEVCWGTAHLLPGTRIVGLLNVIYGLLHTPNHDGAVPGRCT